MFFLSHFFLPLAANVAPIEQNSFPSTIPTLFESYPELFFLARKDLALPKELLFSKEKSFSETLFQENFVELDRTLNSLKCFSLILDGSARAYEELVLKQPDALRLTKESFSTLHEFAQGLMKSHPKIPANEMVRICQAALILKALERERTLTSKEKSDLFPALSKDAKEFLFDSSQPMNYSHIFHLDGGREMFQLLKEKIVAKKATPLSLDFDLFIYLCSFAGKGEDLSPSSFALTQKTFLSFQIARDSLLHLSSSGKLEEAYFLCVEKRASLLNVDLKKSSDRTLVRIASLLHLSSPNEGKLLKEAFHSLSYAPKESIFIQFDEKKSPTSTPLYLSDLLLNVFYASSAGSTSKERMQTTVHSALPLLAQIFKEYQERVSLGHLDPKIGLNFQKAALFVKEHTADLDHLSYQIDKEGQVTLFVTLENSEKK